MNYLAHLFLSRHHPDSVLGNFLTDMMTIDEIKAWPAKFKEGVQLHHDIDAYTDQHPANQNMKRILRPYFHKYAGVALDLYYDYILYENWPVYSDLDFPIFRERQYNIIRDKQAAIPDRLQGRVEQMIVGDFLHRYTTLEGQSFAFSKLNRRARFYTGFERAVDVLETHYVDLTNHFHLFFPDLIGEVDRWNVIKANG